MRLTKEQLDQVPYHRGPYDPTIVFIGEAPGYDEEQDPQKRPFIGSSGRLLESLIVKAGIDINKCYFTNVLKERPPDNKFPLFVKENPNAYETYTKLLSAELASLSNVNLVVPVGAEALKVVCGRDGIEKWRGSIIPATMDSIKGKKCVSIIHPAAILRNWLYKPATVVDVDRIKAESTTPEIDLPKRKCIIRPTFDITITKINELKKSTNWLSVDVETLFGKIVSIQLCDNPFESITIPFQYKNGNSYWPRDQELIIWRMLVDLLHNCGGQRIIGQNFVTYDTFMFGMHGFNWKKILDNILLDVMEGAQCLQPQLPKALAFLTSVFTREPFYKDEGKEWETKQGEDEFWTYGGKDVLVVSEIAPQIKKELEDDGLWDFYVKRFRGMTDKRMKMSMHGFRRDEKKRKELEVKFTRDIIIEQAKLNVLTGQQLNVKSPKQMMHFLYDVMKLPKQYNRDKVTTDENALLTLSAIQPSTFFGHVIKIRELRTLKSNNIDAKCDSDGYFRSSFNFVETGRFSSFSCPFGTGSNLQNITLSMRVMFIPDEGLVLGEGDLSQAEARVVIWRAGSKKMMEIFTSGGDIHKQVASIIFELPIEKITKMQRQTAKRVVHASNYDMQAKKFAQVFNKDAAVNGFPLIDSKQAQRYLDAYHYNVPEIRGVFQAEIKDEVASKKILFNPFGRRMVFHDRIGDDLFRAAYGWYAQSTVADLANTIFERTADKIDIIHQNHDSLIFQNTAEKLKDDAILMNEMSNITIEISGRKLVVPMDFKMGLNWGEMKDMEIVRKEAA